MWWLLPCILGFIRLYLDGVKVLLYQLFNRSFTLPAGNEEQEGLAAVKKIREDLNQGKVEFMYLDLASLTSVRHFVQRYKAKGLPLHVLVNNVKGIYNFAALRVSVVVKITVSSMPAMCYSAHGAYAQSKLALLLFSYHLQDELWVRGDSVTVNAVDPGMVDTALYDNLCSPAQLAKKPFAKLLFRTPAEGASTAIYAAAASELEGIGGLYLYNGRKTESSALSHDQRLQNKLWKESYALVGLQ
ncbi:hypothetical protein cypCar_00030528 [Cyprinus carpio]|nr:hypothetical protein cypCar_00030528 [Cyprinus carpio]